MTPRSPLFSLVFLASIVSISIVSKTSSSLSTVAISGTPNFTLICALIVTNHSSTQQPQSRINCSAFPATAQIQISSDAPLSAIVGGSGFVCGLRRLSPSNESLNCWRFSDNGTVLTQREDGTVLTSDKRIYSGGRLAELRSGDHSVCAIFEESRRMQCWQWPRFSAPNRQNIPSIAVGDDFVCWLSAGGVIDCYGGYSSVVGSFPRGVFSAVSAGSRHACGIHRNGSVNCWGESPGGPPPGERLEWLALGDGRSCGIRRHNRTAVCWGEGNFSLPENLAGDPFLEIESKGSVFCGIHAENYSLLCWGSQAFAPARKVFEKILPGPCKDHCPCQTLLGSGSLCPSGKICERCELPEFPPPALPPGARNPPSSGAGKTRIAFLVVGSVGSFIGLAAGVCFLVSRHCREQLHSSRVHDSGQLDEEAPSQPTAVRSSRRIAQLDSLRPHPDRRLSALLSAGTGGNLEEFSLDTLLRVTGNFSDECKVGSGSFGSVYRGTLEDDRVVAIKRAEVSISSSHPVAGASAEEKEYAFLSELGLLSRVNHKNLVRLIGYSIDGDERLLVYEFMPNGTLHEHLHKLESSPLMSWVVRLKVALDAARGIEYLHAYAVPQIIHRDIKSSNILLDDEWTAKVSDFGLSLLGPNPDDDSSHLSLRAAGTVGYMDPEYYRLQQLTTKSDVYSFGVLLLELLTGYKAIHRVEPDAPPRNVVDFAVPSIASGEVHHVLDRRLPPPTPQEMEAVEYAGYLAADCVSLQGRDRPSMSNIVNDLERALAACLVEASPLTSPSTTASPAQH